MKKIVILDLNIGNLNSIYNAISKIYQNVVISSNLSIIKNSDLIVIPGNGSFKEAIKNLKANKLFEFLKEIYKHKKKKIIGICIGMQIFLNSSEEDGYEEGLSIISGKVQIIKNIKNIDHFCLPHIGWNEVKLIKKNSFLKDVEDNSDFYFLNSYGCQVSDANSIIGITNYSQDIASIINKDNFFGVQFHPEKSLKNGKKILENWIKLSC
jgi:imidazole glycerol-phosphate synthase subunit HisH